jgi:hypothetical protein
MSPLSTTRRRTAIPSPTKQRGGDQEGDVSIRDVLVVQRAGQQGEAEHGEPAACLQYDDEQQRRQDRQVGAEEELVGEAHRERLPAADREPRRREQRRRRGDEQPQQDVDSSSATASQPIAASKLCSLASRRAQAFAAQAAATMNASRRDDAASQAGTRLIP